jgi:cation diffusion facilitator family transporter
MSGQTDIHLAQKEKRGAALNSVFAAIGLTLLKIIVGVLTNSLGILAEAAHSGLDLVAALVTFLAVRISGRPADKTHPYGHGKVENLSALFETFLLLATCVWIIYEALQRLFVHANVEIDPSIWAFLVMFISIGIDYSRSRMLYRIARKHNSQALEADALHFSTDIWSSSVVIFGLLCVVIGSNVESLAFLKKADAVAALAVAGIVIYVSLEMGYRTVLALLDSAPKGMDEKILDAVKVIPGVADCHQLRMRHSGPHLFIDAHILVARSLTINEAHALTEKVENEILLLSPGADVTLHTEPAPEPLENVAAKPLS